MRRTNALLFRVRAASVRTALSIALLMNSSCGKQDAPAAQAAEEAGAEPAEMPDTQPAAPPLWKPIPWSGSYIPTPQAIRSQAVAIDVKLLQPPDNERISLTLPDESRITAVKARFSEKGENRFIWRGTIEGRSRWHGRVLRRKRDARWRHRDLTRKNVPCQVRGERSQYRRAAGSRQVSARE